MALRFVPLGEQETSDLIGRHLPLLSPSEKKRRSVRGCTSIEACTSATRGRPYTRPSGCRLVDREQTHACVVLLCLRLRAHTSVLLTRRSAGRMQCVGSRRAVVFFKSTTQVTIRTIDDSDKHQSLRHENRAEARSKSIAHR